MKRPVFYTWSTASKDNYCRSWNKRLESRNAKKLFGIYYWLQRKAMNLNGLWKIIGFL